MTLEQINRFVAKLSGEVEGCWEYTGATNIHGYGVCKIGGKNYYAHRVAYAMAAKINPDQVEGYVMHLCNNPKCCNPAHLSLGTEEQNRQYKMLCGRHRMSKKGCKRKLNEEKVAAIKYRISREHAFGSIAKDYGVSKWLIKDIASGKAWKKVKPNPRPVVSVAKAG